MYGTTPGVWQLGVAGNRWKLLDQKCALTNFLDVKSICSGSSKLVVLLLGDSVDRFQLSDLCNFCSSDASWYSKESSYNGINHCNTNLHLNSNISHTFYHLIPGVHPDGPYLHNVQSSASTRIRSAISEVQSLTGKKPSLIVLNSNFWDIGRVNAYENDLFKKMLESPEVINKWLEGYVSNLSSVMNFIVQEAGSKTVFAYHTAPIPDNNPLTGKTICAGSKSIFAAVNAGGRQAAQEHGFHLVDLEMMTAQLQPKHYLRDYPGGWHPSTVIMLEAMNIYLNIVHK